MFFGKNYGNHDILDIKSSNTNSIKIKISVEVEAQLQHKVSFQFEQDNKQNNNTCDYYSLFKTMTNNQIKTTKLSRALQDYYNGIINEEELENFMNVYQIKINKLTDDEAMLRILVLYEFLDTNIKLDFNDIAEILSISPSQVQIVIKKMRENGIL